MFPVLNRKPTLAVWKFTSCDGCQLSILDMEDEFIDIASAFEISMFVEATRNQAPGPYDISLVEGSVSTPAEAKRIVDIRKESKILVTIGACATSGGIQALRNFSDVGEYASMVYASPEHLSLMKTSEPIKHYVDVDYELYGCPISKKVLLEFIISTLIGKSPRLPSSSVCMECKSNGYNCLAVTNASPCLGPVTRSGCEALCLSYDRPCFGCFGPKEYANLPSMTEIFKNKNVPEDELIRLYRTFNAHSELLARASKDLEGKE
ncbi:MAG: hypothetical protein ABUK01_17740 [Leptospirales bacterium]